MADVARQTATRPGGRAPLRWWKEVAYAGAIYLVYSAVRNRFGSAGGDPGPAYDHAKLVIDFERWLGLYVEPDIQQWYLRLPAHGVIRVWNVFYGLAHFVVTGGALIWLYRKDPRRYPLWRNTLAFMTVVALIGFASFSLMPPRLLDDPGRYGGCQIYAAEDLTRAGRTPGAEDAAVADGDDPVCNRYGMVDTVALHGGWVSFGDEGMEEVSNQYAAMPSMHIGWSTWSALVLVPLLRRRRWRAVATAHPFVTLVCIIVTANHYWIDGVGGLVCLGAGYGLALLVEHARAAEPVDAGHAPAS